MSTHTLVYSITHEDLAGAVADALNDLAEEAGSAKCGSIDTGQRHDIATIDGVAEWLTSAAAKEDVLDVIRKRTYPRPAGE